jgi:hypothetical protein
MISAHAVSGLWQLRQIGEGDTEEEREESALATVIEEAQAEGLTPTHDHLRAVCVRRFAYKTAKAGPNPILAACYEDYKQDLQTVAPLGLRDTDFSGTVEKAKARPGDFAANLVAVCTDERKLPGRNELLRVATGPDLAAVVPGLLALATDLADVEGKKKLLKTKEAELKAMRHTRAYATIKEEADKLRAELEAMGALPKKGGRRPGLKIAGGADRYEDAGEDAGHEAIGQADNEVLDALDSAKADLEQGLDSDWPEAPDAITAILERVRECEALLDQIKARAAIDDD